MNSTTVGKYVLLFSGIVCLGYFVNKFREHETEEHQDAELNLIRKFLLNESQLYGYNKPKLWIHTKYEVNSRQWKSFYSRNSTDLNQPYIHLTVKTIINHCGQDFNVCLIDDQTFSKLIPSWKINMSFLSSPMKERARTYGLAQLLYIYGGLVIPNSFVCSKNLKSFFEMATSGESPSNTKPFFVENINHTTLQQNHQQVKFIPNLAFMGVKEKNDKHMKSFVQMLHTQITDPSHFHIQSEFNGSNATWCFDQIQKGNFKLISGEFIGVKTIQQNPILIEELLSESFLEIHPNAYGVYIPNDEILTRLKYQWFASISSQEVLDASTAISRYIVASIVDSNNYSLDKSNTIIKESTVGSM